MKKVLTISLVVIMCLAVLVGCSNIVTPSSSILWIAPETTTYDVRRASDYELAYIGIYDTVSKKEDGTYDFANAYEQLIPDDAYGTYTTTISNTGDAQNPLYLYTTTLSVTEVYKKEGCFTGKNDLYDLTVAKVAQSNGILQMAGEDVICNVRVDSSSTFTANSNLLPQTSTKTVKSVFIGCGVCQTNDFTTTVNYDYSAKTPKATSTTNFTGTEVTTTTKLTKTATAKTYDNEQLLMTIRSFDVSALANNGTSSISVFEGTSEGKINLGITVGQKHNFDIVVGGAYKTLDDDGNFVYYKDGDNYTDPNGNLVATQNRNVNLMAITSAGRPIALYFDNDQGTMAKHTLIRMQQSYLHFDITQSCLSNI